MNITTGPLLFILTAVNYRKEIFSVLHKLQFENLKWLQVYSPEAFYRQILF